MPDLCKRLRTKVHVKILRQLPAYLYTPIFTTTLLENRLLRYEEKIEYGNGWRRP